MSLGAGVVSDVLGALGHTLSQFSGQQQTDAWAFPESQGVSAWLGHSEDLTHKGVCGSWEEGPLVEELAPSDWFVSCLGGIFLDSELM